MPRNGGSFLAGQAGPGHELLAFVHPDIDRLGHRPAGTAPVTLPLERGNHSLRVVAPGYEDLNEVIAVRGDMTFSAVLQGRAYRLSVTANVVGAQVYVNNAPVGSTPFEGRFAAGTYSVRVTAQGYQEAGTTIRLSRTISQLDRASTMR